MGARRLRAWLLSPLAKLDAIQRRQDAVAELHDDSELRALVKEHLGQILDLERLSSRAAFGRANARDLVGLRQSLEQLPTLRARFVECRSELLRELGEGIDLLEDLTSAIADAVVDEPPTTIKEGGLIRRGFHAELDELRGLHTTLDGGASYERQRRTFERTKRLPDVVASIAAELALPSSTRR